MKVHNPLPESLAISCDKAESILEHFIKGNNQLDNSLIPKNVLARARGIAIITIVKAGFLWSGRGGTGLVLSRLEDGSWSAPSAIMAAGVGIGAQIGAQITDVVFILNNSEAVKAFCRGNVTLGGNVSVAAGPTGRSTEAAGSVVNPAPIYSYSKSKGLFVGMTLEGTLILTRQKANRELYGRDISAQEILSGRVPCPAEADGLYRMLNLKFSTLGTFKKDSIDDELIQSSITTLNASRDSEVIQNNYSLKSSSENAGTRKRNPPPPPKPLKLAAKPKQAVAMFDFDGQRVGDLSFKEGDVIWVSEKQGEWYHGTLNGRKGIFPGNYVSLDQISSLN
ncbi:hypothetical protein HDV02_001816 [Globomyces sp. JEL0801]|nr:hypothetical protein HDV02_001816 [Globomyces sp. JEL0801]